MVKKIAAALNIVIPFLQQCPKWIQVLVTVGVVYVILVIVVIFIWFLIFRSPQKEMSNSLDNYGRTQLYARTKKRINDLYNEIYNEKLKPWVFINTGKPLRVEKHDGTLIQYQGCAFGTTESAVFWGDNFIPPIIENAIVKAFDQTIEECRKNNKDPKEYIDEANRLLNGFIFRVYNRMADIDQRLQGKGYPKNVQRKDVSVEINKMNECLKGHYEAAVLLASKTEITGNISKPRTQIVDKCMPFFSIIWKILAGSALLLGLFVSFITISSKISVRSDDPINRSDPFSTPFQIKNVGHTPVFNITFLCTIREVKFDNRASIYNIDTRIDNPPIPKIRSGEETTTFFKCLPHKSPITSADIEIAVSYRPMWVFRKREKRFRFATIPREDELYWVPLALSQ